MNHDVFISYSQRVPEPTIALADELIRRGFRPWYDVNLLPGQVFGKVIDDAIDRAKAVVTIWSAPSLASKWVPAESERALNQNKLICVRTEDVDPRSLPTPYNRMHVPLWNDFHGLLQALTDRGVHPSGSGPATDIEALLQDAQRAWKIVPKDDAEAIEAFLELYGQFAMFRVMAKKRLEALLACGTPGLRPTPLPDPPPVKPEDVILRIDPGMHTAPIRCISVTSDGRILATASEDKTVKLWMLPDGKLLRTLRLPIGPGDEGKVYAVALDPSGRWVATGGADADEDWVRLFDSSTGAVRARLGPLPNRILDLAVSPDGLRLAAGLGGCSGIRVWDVPRALGGDTHPIIEDKDYLGAVYGLTFGPLGTRAAGRLASTSTDGQLRLYSPDGRLLAKTKASGGVHLHGIAISPDGRVLAVGYGDTLRVGLCDAETLLEVGLADVSGDADNSLEFVTFLSSGSAGIPPRLAAGGEFQQHWRFPIQVWEDGGRGARTTWSGPNGPNGTVTGLACLPGGEVAFCTADPAFGFIDFTRKKIHSENPTTADMRGKRRGGFTVSADGRRFRFGASHGEAKPVLFELATRRLTDAPKPLLGGLFFGNTYRDLAQANTDGLRIEGWENSKSPKLDGEPLEFMQDECTRSLAIAPDARSFVLGAEWSLSRFDSKGAQLWKKPVPGIVWGVNLAREGRLILAAYGDGTIRWHRAEDGEELLALFIHLPGGPDGPREWILFTPEGYYEASSLEAEKLIGWHVNRGPDEAADFYPANTFASAYRSPERIDAALAAV